MSSHTPAFADVGLSSVIALLLTSVFIYFAARFVIDRSSILSAILTALLGTIAAGLVYQFVGGVLGLSLAVIVWALIAALFFRTSWIKGAIIGLVAWVLWLLVQLLVRALR